MDRTDIPYISATELAEFIRKREVSPIEAVEAYLERIESLNGKLSTLFSRCVVMRRLRRFKRQSRPFPEATI
jgi:Asp-tRNA(Asn)/Glu-tRNA(Gln) amidotransferase A subunit family amidase